MAKHYLNILCACSSHPFAGGTNVQIGLEGTRGTSLIVKLGTRTPLCHWRSSNTERLLVAHRGVRHRSFVPCGKIVHELQTIHRSSFEKHGMNIYQNENSTFHNKCGSSFAGTGEAPRPPAMTASSMNGESGPSAREADKCSCEASFFCTVVSFFN